MTVRRALDQFTHLRCCAFCFFLGKHFRFPEQEQVDRKLDQLATAGDVYKLATASVASNRRATSTAQHSNGMWTTTRQLWLLLLLGGLIEAKQLFIARSPRSVYGPPSGGLSSLGGIGGLGGLGWNTVSSYSPITVGHMTKDELLTLLEAWEEVEQETKTQAPEPAKPPRPARPPKRPAKPAAARPRPAAPPAAAAAAGAGAGAGAEAGPRPGAPITVRLPAFVPIQLSAMYTQPLTVVPAPALGGGGGGGAAGAAAAAAGGGGGGGGGNAAAAASAATGGGGAGAAAAAAAAGSRIGYGLDSDYTDLEQLESPQEEGGQRFFRYLQYPMTGAQPHTRSAAAAAAPSSPPVMRNTLESVDAGVAPLSTFAKVKSKSTYFRPSQGPPPPALTGPPPSSHSGPVVRPR